MASINIAPPRKAIGWAARDKGGLLAPFNFHRRNPRDDDVVIKILFCGICHSDLHSIKNDWNTTQYPVVPGHEIAGIVTEVGNKVTKFKVGDNVGVGCLVNSCRSCPSCNLTFENYCPEPIFTYNSVDADGTMTYGGYSDMIVVNEHFVIRFPETMPLDKGAPLLCAGITVYAAMKYYGLNHKGMHIGVVGLRGLGHVAVKFAKAFGLKVTVISTSPSKETQAIEQLGADGFVNSNDPEQMKAARDTLNGVINTVCVKQNLKPQLSLLEPYGKMVMLGIPEEPLDLSTLDSYIGPKSISGSNIGGLKDTQEMMDFAAEHGITADIELISIDDVNTAMERLQKADVRFRFVIDVGNTLKTA